MAAGRNEGEGGRAWMVRAVGVRHLGGGTLREGVLFKTPAIFIEVVLVVRRVFVVVDG